MTNVEASEDEGGMIRKETKDDIQKILNVGLVPDEEYSPREEYPIEWFVRYFSFLNNSPLEKRLGESFYQARFCYNLMTKLGLPLAKYKAMVNMQIILYASICEAIIQNCIEDFYKEDFQKRYAIAQFVKCSNAMSVDTHISHGSTPLYLCREKYIKADIKRERMDHKTDFAVDKHIITGDTKAKFDMLYDMRNNIHILKATQNNYNPRKHEAKDAFLLMQQCVEAVKSFYKRCE